MITIKTKPGREYFKELKIRYKKATKRQKKTILDEFTQTTGYHRKHAIDLLTGNYKQHTGSIYRPHKTYTREDADIFVEQKNDSIVRNWVGYGRFNTQPQVDILNEFYELLRLYTNFFLPVMRLKKKARVGSKIKKIYDKPTTPYRRILRARDVSKEVKDKLRNQYKTLSLVKLKEQIDEVLKRLKPTKLE